MRRLLAVTTILIILGSLPSCRLLYPNQVFKQKDYQYFDMVQKQMTQYIIQPGDAFTLKIFARDGFKLIDVFGSNSTIETQNASVNGAVKAFTYVVDNEGVVKLPVLGYLYVKGFTETELERVLAEKYSGLFVDPWVSVKVVNRRVFVFKGGAASIVTLEDYPISLIEVLARTGGLDNDSKSYNIRVVRGDIKNPEIYLVDLSTIEGIRKADLSVQPNDIVVVQRRKRVVSDVLRETAPYLSAITTITTFVLLFKTLGK
jgi:polysaccharide export outer membrane protein